jgi:hypothetical protein
MSIPSLYVIVMLNNVVTAINCVCSISGFVLAAFMIASAIAYSKPFWRCDEMRRGGFICLFVLIISLLLSAVVPNTKQAIIMLVGSRLNDPVAMEQIPAEFTEIYKTELVNFKNNFDKKNVN